MDVIAGTVVGLGEVGLRLAGVSKNVKYLLQERGLYDPKMKFKCAVVETEAEKLARKANKLAVAHAKKQVDAAAAAHTKASTQLHTLRSNKAEERRSRSSSCCPRG